MQQGGKTNAVVNSRFRLFCLLFVVSHEKVYIPAMKQFVLEFKNLAGQQRGAASISTASEKERQHSYST